MESKSVGRTVMEGLGVLSVVLSLAFVALQIKQSRDQARAAIQYEIAESFNGYHDLLAGNAELAEIVSQLAQASPQFTTAESWRARAAMSRLLNTWMAVQKAHDNGLMTTQEFQGALSDVESTVAALPGAVPLWARMINGRPGFAEYPIFSPIVEQM